TMHSPDYRSVCTGQTGHAEVVEVEYDAAQVDFATLMSCFFEWHDPTQINRQGPDIGTQYRTTIFPQSSEQRTQAQKKIDQLNQSDGHSKPIATTIETADKFWPAEDYHQHYLDKRGLSHCGI
ncbi:MAG: peptide-methionine (S)-S-oxide reductase MsrA, partial [Gammaproteobacteria bacterium]